MIDSESLAASIGAPVYGPGDEKIGTVSRIYADPDTDTTSWVTVRTGLFGMHESFMPIIDATWDGEAVRVPFDKSLVKDAPRIDTDTALESVAVTDLNHHYGITAIRATGNSETPRPDDAPRPDEPLDAPEETRPLDAPGPVVPPGPLGAPGPGGGLGGGLGGPAIGGPLDDELPPDGTGPRHRI